MLEVAAPRGDFVLRDGTRPGRADQRRRRRDAGPGDAPRAGRATQRAAGLVAARRAQPRRARLRAPRSTRCSPRSRTRHRLVAYSRPRRTAPADHDVAGRLDGALLDQARRPGRRRLLPLRARRRSCGRSAPRWPPAASRPTAIATEAFGAVAVHTLRHRRRRRPRAARPGRPARHRAGRHASRAATSTCRGTTATRACSTSPRPATCRSASAAATGVCHNCESGLLAGDVAYHIEPLEPPPDGPRARLLHPARRGADARPLSGHQRELADPPRVQPLDPQPVGGEQVGQRPAADLRGDGRGLRGVRVRQRLRRRAVRAAVVRLPRDDEPGPLQRRGQLVERGEPDRVGVGHRRPLGRRQRRPSSSVKAKRPPGPSAAAIARTSASLSSTASIASSSSTTSNAPAGQRRRLRDREAARQVARLLAGDRDGARAEVHAQVAAAQLPREEPPGPGDAAADVQHADAGADAGPRRQGADLARGHEALLPDELARAVRRRADAVQRPVERRAVVLPHRAARTR